jgi:hypothetical protein
VGPWKLHLWREGAELAELYDLSTDPGETRNLHAERPDVVTALHRVAARLRAELGDARLGIAGTGCRPVGRVPDPRPLTTFDPTSPYLVAEYDLADRG